MTRGSNNGYIALHRKIQDNFLWKEPRKFSKAEAWIDILMEVQHSEQPQEVVLGMRVLVCNYAQSLKSIKTWATRWNWSQSKVRRFFALLKQRRMIDTENEAITTRLTVCNYSKYDPKRRANGEQMKSKRRGSGEQAVTDNNDNNANNDNNIKRRHSKFIKPTAEQVSEYAASIGFELDGQQFIDFYEAKGWMIGKSKMRDWKAAVRTWQRRDLDGSNKKRPEFPQSSNIGETIEA